jgi:hypothetical protein
MTAFSVARDAVLRLVAEVGEHGAVRVETGGFLLSRPTADGRHDILALAGEEGVRRSQDLFEVSGEAVERLFGWAAEQELRIGVQVHSHRQEAFLSRTDLRHGFTVEGFTTSVIPTYADPPRNPGSWGWWTCKAGEWKSTQPPAVVEGPAEVVRFDSGGVDAA